jgi:hypothetical protein
VHWLYHSLDGPLLLIAGELGRADSHLSRRRASQFTYCRETQYSDQHLYPASAAVPTGILWVCAGFSNAYLEKRTNRLSGNLSLEPSLAKYTRRGVDLDTYWSSRISTRKAAFFFEWSRI